MPLQLIRLKTIQHQYLYPANKLRFQTHDGRVPIVSPVYFLTASFFSYTHCFFPVFHLLLV